MARKLRMQYPEAIYHVLNRGDGREPIFNGDKDRVLFLDTLGEACEKPDFGGHYSREEATAHPPICSRGEPCYENRKNDRE